MENSEWLSLSEYSRRYEVSVSTLRRRIKNNQVEHGYRNGKYFLKNKALGDHGSMNEVQVKKTTIAPPQMRNSYQPSRPSPRVEKQQEEVAASLSKSTSESEAPMLATANKLLNELKKAYTLVLQEKEEQVIQLKEQVADLQTLVRVLEVQIAEKKEKSALPVEASTNRKSDKDFKSSFDLLDEEELYLSPSEPSIELSDDPWLD